MIDFFQYLKQAANEYAPGIPSKSVLSNPPLVDSPQTWELGIHEHNAKKAGLHWDLRLGDPSSGHAYSWAIPKARLPERGERLLAVAQPLHTLEYMDFKGEIMDGYGAGSVSLPIREKTELIYSKPNKGLRFHRYIGRNSEEYLLVKSSKTDDKSKAIWFITNVTPVTTTPSNIPLIRPDYKSKEPHELDEHNNDQVWLSKIDGAHSLSHLSSKGIRIYAPQRDLQTVVDHSPRLHDIHFTQVPKELHDTVVRTELFATDPITKKAIPAAKLGGLLNSSIWTFKNNASNPDMRLALIDVVTHKGKDVSSLPFGEKWQILKRINELIPKLELPPHAETPSEKLKLKNEIQTGRHLLTEEGLIVQTLSTKAKPIKVPFKPTHDVYIRGVVPMIDHPDMMGALEYSLTPDGPITGTVGTGFDHDLRRDIMAKSKDYLGRAARLTSKGQYSSGALRTPAFESWHLEKGL